MTPQAMAQMRSGGGGMPSMAGAMRGSLPSGYGSGFGGLPGGNASTGLQRAPAMTGIGQYRPGMQTGKIDLSKFFENLRNPPPPPPAPMFSGGFDPYHVPVHLLTGDATGPSAPGPTGPTGDPGPTGPDTSAGPPGSEY